MKAPWTKGTPNMALSITSATIPPYPIGMAQVLGVPMGTPGILAGRHAPPQKIDQATPVMGWREFHINSDGSLKGMYGGVWKAGVYEATCEEGIDPQMREFIRNIIGDELWGEHIKRGTDGNRQRCLDHLSAGACSCGVYGRTVLPVYGSYRSYPDSVLPPVVARTLAYGTVAADDEGNWRASDVKLESLYVVQSRVQVAAFVDWDRMSYDLSGRYGVPVRRVLQESDIEVQA